MEEKIVKKKPRKTKKKEPVLTHFTELEVRRIETNHKEELNKKLEKKVMDLEIRLKVSQLEIVKKDIELLKLKTEKLDLVHNNQRQSYNKFYEELKEKYNLKTGFGFNPDTGEIKP